MVELKVSDELLLKLNSAWISYFCKDIENIKQENFRNIFENWLNTVYCLKYDYDRRIAYFKSDKELVLFLLTIG
jgi:hypothetical protein